MAKNIYHELAAKGVCLPIGTHLVLHEKQDPEAIMLNGESLGDVVIEAAQRFQTTVGIPLMDLALEKEALLAVLGVESAEREKFHFKDLPAEDALKKVQNDPFMQPRMVATCEAVARVAEREAETGVVSLGMSIGPFSLVTKLLSDPITPVYMAGMGMDDEDVELLDRVLELAEHIVLRYVEAQMDSGAKGIFVCEPAANKVYFSPKQLEQGSDIFERFVMAPNMRLKAALEARGVDLVFHDCGELTDQMVKDFNRLEPAVLSLGCSRKLWEDAALLSKDIVLYGNLPSKQFYSDENISAEEVRSMTEDLMARMRETGHPFIMGTECDVLSVPGCETSIRSKVDAMMGCSCKGNAHG